MTLSDRFWVAAFMLLAPDGDGSGGGDGEGSGGDSGSSSSEKGFQKRLARHDDALSLAHELWEDNHNYRRRNAELTTKLTETTGKVPVAGTVVLTTEQAQQWAAYQALGTPDKVKESIDKAGELQTKLDQTARQVILRDAATVAGFNYAALEDAVMLTETKGGKKLSFEVKEVDTNGEKVKTGFVKDGEVVKPIAEYAQENWGTLLPALTVQGESSSTEQASGGTTYPSQHQGSGGGSKPNTPKQQTQQTLSNHYPSRKRDS